MRNLVLAPIILTLALLTSHVHSLEVKHQEHSVAFAQHIEKIKSLSGAHSAPKKASKAKKAVKATPKPKVAPVATTPVKTGVEQWRKLVTFYFPASQVDKALAVMSGESGGNPKALSPTCDRGLFQINCVHSAKVGGDLNKLYDPEINVQVALQIWEDQGWCPWTVGRSLGYCA